MHQACRLVAAAPPGVLPVPPALAEQRDPSGMHVADRLESDWQVLIWL
jgi:hypothetical protein